MQKFKNKEYLLICIVKKTQTSKDLHVSKSGVPILLCKVLRHLQSQVWFSATKIQYGDFTAVSHGAFKARDVQR